MPREPLQRGDHRNEHEKDERVEHTPAPAEWRRGIAHRLMRLIRLAARHGTAGAPRWLSRFASSRHAPGTPAGTWRNMAYAQYSNTPLPYLA